MPANLTAVQAGDAGFIAANTTAVTRVAMTVYSANHIWIGLTATISILLLLCGLLGMLFKYAAAAPDILGYVSTLVRDDESQPWPASVTDAQTMDGLDRARLLRNVNVQIVTGAKEEEGRTYAWLKRL